MNAKHLESLLVAWEEDSLSPDELAELKHLLATEAQARRRLVESGLLRSAVVDRQVCALPPAEEARSTGEISRFPRRQRQLFAAAAALIIVGALTWLSLSRTSDTGLILASADAAVTVERKNEALRLPVGESLYAGDVIATDAAAIVVSYPEEETRLEIAPATRLEVLPHGAGKRFRLLVGSLSADVSPQPETQPMRLFTPGAEAVVLGTRFSISTEDLAVQKGAVRVNRAGLGRSVVVSSQEAVNLAAGELEIEALAPGEIPSPWRDENTLGFDFDRGLDWRHLRHGRVTADPDSPGGQCLAAEIAWVEEEPRCFAVSLRTSSVLTAESHLSFRYWVAPGSGKLRVRLYTDEALRSFTTEIHPEAYGRWVRWSGRIDELLSVVPLEPEGKIRSSSVGSKTRVIGIYGVPSENPPPMYLDDVTLSNVSMP